RLFLHKLGRGNRLPVVPTDPASPLVQSEPKGPLARNTYLMLAALSTFSFELSSAATCLSISDGVIGIGLIASCLRRCCIAGLASTVPAVAWNFSTISRGVFPGMNTPYQMVRSELG